MAVMGLILGFLRAVLLPRAVLVAEILALRWQMQGAPRRTDFLLEQRLRPCPFRSAPRSGATAGIPIRGRRAAKPTAR